MERAKAEEEAAEAEWAAAVAAQEAWEAAQAERRAAVAAARAAAGLPPEEAPQVRGPPSDRRTCPVMEVLTPLDPQKFGHTSALHTSV